MYYFCKFVFYHKKINSHNKSCLQNLDDTMDIFSLVQLSY